MGKLNDMVAVIGGASTGMGAATARLFAQEGAAVVVAARSSGKLHTLVDEITRDGGTALAMPTDANDRAAVAALAERTREQFGKIDVLVNSVGTNIKEPRLYRDGARRLGHDDRAQSHGCVQPRGCGFANNARARRGHDHSLLFRCRAEAQRGFRYCLPGGETRRAGIGARNYDGGTRARHSRFGGLSRPLRNAAAGKTAGGRRRRKHSPRCYNRKTWRRRRSLSLPYLPAHSCRNWCLGQVGCRGCGARLLPTIVTGSGHHPLFSANWLRRAPQVVDVTPCGIEESLNPPHRASNDSRRLT